MDENIIFEEECAIAEGDLKQLPEAVEEKPDAKIDVKLEDTEGALIAEIESLKAELARRDEVERASARMMDELKELEEYFPEVELSEIPEQVWEKVRLGTSLASSYALFKRKAELEKNKADDFNRKNRRMSAGSLLQGEGERYYSPSEVKKMSPAQVKKNYDDIIESMRHWN